jgi:hypothetical protein
MWEITYSIKLHGATEGGTGADMESKDGRKGKSGDIVKRELHISCFHLSFQACAKHIFHDPDTRGKRVRVNLAFGPIGNA